MAAACTWAASLRHAFLLSLLTLHNRAVTCQLQVVETFTTSVLPVLSNARAAAVQQLSNGPMASHAEVTVDAAIMGVGSLLGLIVGFKLLTIALSIVAFILCCRRGGRRHRSHQ